MDNLTHSLVGLAIGELVQRSVSPEPTPARQRTRRRLLLTAGWLASNFPDLDLLLTGLLPDPLGYLLHHRGHTHTLLYLLPQGALLLVLLWALWPGARALLRESRPARTALALAIGIGLVFHIVMDWLNSYGVHPFHPFDSRWLYGDRVFILEPVFWVALGAPLAMTAPWKWLRAVLLGLLAMVLAWATASAYLHWASAAALVLGGLGLGLLQARAGMVRRYGIGAGVALAAAYIGLQGVASAAGKQEVRAQASAGAKLFDVVMNAYPANPFCWNFIAVEQEQALYRVRRGSLSVMPSLVPLGACPAAFNDAFAGRELNPGLRMTSETEYSVMELVGRSANCHFNAWLRFARVPVLGENGATDGRFSMQDGSNFSTLPYAALAGQPCPSQVPGWDMPRADMLLAR